MNRHDSEFLLHERFAAQVALTPASIALYEGERSVTYAELGAAVDRAAGALLARGVGEGCAVGLHLERSIEYVASLLAVLKCGGAVVPLPPSYPAGRLREILSFAALDAVLDDARTPLPEGLHRHVVSAAQLDGAGQAPAQARACRPDQIAFVLCSSGSTGTPKLIARSHRSFFHRLEWTWARHPYAPGEVCCQKAHMTTTHAIYELFEPLLRGVPTVIVSDQETRSLERFWETVAARGVTRLLIVPSMLQASLDMPGFAAPPLDVVVLMGEYVHPRLAARALEAFPAKTAIYSIYGSTEASSTLVCDLRESFRGGDELPLGRPISPEVRAVVLGPALEEVAPGEAGMLHISGPALFEGYFRNPALTETVLVSSPRGERLYDTRDRVRLLSDGSLQFIGRVDHTVKIRGFRVDLQEVERALLRHPEVRQAAIVVDGAAASGARLLGFYAPATANQAGVYETVRDLLPAYMVPSVLVGLEAFPLTASGKIDRARLAEEHARRPAPGGSERERTPTERRVSEVWAGVLGQAQIPLDRSFFELGGTSLTVFAAVHRLREAFALGRERLTDQSIYQFASVEALAAYIDRVLAGAVATAAPAPAQSILVTLKRGRDPDLPPFFLIASAGGTLGAYERMVKALETARDVVGVRDPFNWGDRDPVSGFDTWVARYVEAIRARQPHGPYFIGAYSSAGAFGYEIARRLRAAGEEVRLLALIDPISMDRGSRRRYGYWAMRARFMRPAFRAIVRLAGRLLGALPLGADAASPVGAGAPPESGGPSREQLRASAGRDRGQVLALSSLLELNTGLPFALAESDVPVSPTADHLAVLLSRLRQVAPEIDPATIEAIAMQYGLQVRAQQLYRLRRYDGPVVLFEPSGRHAGLLPAQLRPYVRDLRVVTLDVGPPDGRTRKLAANLSPSLLDHYLSMRDDRFVAGVAAELGRLLG